MNENETFDQTTTSEHTHEHSHGHNHSHSRDVYGDTCRDWHYCYGGSVRGSCTLQWGHDGDHWCVLCQEYFS